MAAAPPSPAHSSGRVFEAVEDVSGVVIIIIMSG
jgi:hypothetical protein